VFLIGLFLDPEDGGDVFQHFSKSHATETQKTELVVFLISFDLNRRAFFSKIGLTDLEWRGLKHTLDT
jgi:hypothetical protein